MKFQPVTHRGSGISLAVALILLVVGIWLTNLMRQQPPSGLQFWSGLFALTSYGIALFFFYQAYALFRLAYFLTRNGLRIRYGAVTERIPIENITNIIPASDTTIPARQFLGIDLPYWWVGTWSNVGFYSTVKPDRALRVQTEQRDFLVSPSDTAAFMEAWQRRQTLGPTQAWLQETRLWPFFNLPLWTDPLAWRLILGALLVWLILVGSTLSAYPNWPVNIPIGTDPQRQVTTIVPREQFLWLPGIGGAIFLINLVLGIIWHRKERLAAYLIWFLAILVQIGLWVGLRMLVG